MNDMFTNFYKIMLFIPFFGHNVHNPAHVLLEFDRIAILIFITFFKNGFWEPFWVPFRKNVCSHFLAPCSFTIVQCRNLKLLQRTF